MTHPVEDFLKIGLSLFINGQINPLVIDCFVTDGQSGRLDSNSRLGSLPRGSSASLRRNMSQNMSSYLGKRSKKKTGYFMTSSQKVGR